MPDTTPTKEEFEPHLRFTVGSHTDLWHRFRKPKRHPKLGVYLETRCGREIYDHYNVRTTYNPRIDRFCARCFPNGITSDGRPKPSKRDEAGSGTTDAAGDGAPAEEERSDPKGSVPLTSTPELLVPGNSDAGDGGTSPEEGSGVQRTGNDGHVEELPEQSEAGSAPVDSGADSEGGQGSEVREPNKGRKEQSTGQRRKSKEGTA